MDGASVAGERESSEPVAASERRQRRGWLRDQHWNFASEPKETLRRIRGLIKAEIKHLVGVESYIRSEDRRILENVIFPFFLNDDACRNVLFVGSSWCTRGYNRRFEQGKNYWTIDRAPWKRRYGAKHHIIAPLDELRRHFPPQTLDLIVCNGVYGWGLNDRADIEAAFGACRDCLRENGVLVIGWDDVEPFNPCPLSTWDCLRTFRRFHFPPLDTAEFVTATSSRHTYSFYCRPHANESRSDKSEAA